MLSRVAENIYWMARYIERAENTARLVNVNGNLLLDLPRHVRLGWEPLLDISGSREHFAELYHEPDERSVVRFMVSNQNNPGSILSSLNQARENARTIRDIIPREAWEQINELYLRARGEANRVLSRSGRFEYLRHVILGAQTITGLLAGTMNHDEGYDFLRMGRNLERADMTTRIIDVRSATLLSETHEDLTPFENIQWVGVLKSLTGYQMYRRTARIRVRRPDVLRFLFQESVFPRSVAHATGEVEACLAHLPRNEKPLRTVGTLRRKVQRVRPAGLEQAQLHDFIDDLQAGLARVHNSIAATYF
ncbi:MAG TPA: alpha-E domain-containing protein [Thioalkalivibrio sp.]|nr:alpha-E domain-containing protein [Thioalkalivibrio sp.]